MGTKRSGKSEAARRKGDVSTTFSTRLSSDQKRLVEEAARLQNWTPSNLIRVAAVERAAHIVNTGRPTRFGFAELAERLAKQLCEPDMWIPSELVPDKKDIVFWPVMNDDQEVRTMGLEAADLALLREALQLGGGEFMQLVVTACQRRLAKEDLPDPIDPSTLRG